MKSKITWLILSFIIVLSLMLASCTTTVEEEEEEEEIILEEEEEEEEEEEPPVTGDWWDKFGEPEYGGQLVFRGTGLDTLHTDPLVGLPGGQYVYYGEPLFGPQWTLDPSVWPYNCGFCPQEYVTGWLAESWEWSDPLTMTIQLRQGVYWQDRPPVSGREFTADDVQYNFDRVLGTGSGFTEPNAFWINQMPSIEQVVATGKYTVEVKFKSTAAMRIYDILEPQLWSAFIMLPHEVVEQGGADYWEQALGTGAFMITDFIRGSSITFSKNPNYWGYDERHPENQLPYIDTLKVLQIDDMSTTIAAMRTGKIDMLMDPRGGLTWQQAKSIAKSNPEIQHGNLASNGEAIEFRCDREPFTDINVRKALQMSLNREVIAQTYYGGTVDGKPCGTANPTVYKDWVTLYDDWPQELQDEYSYNPERAKELLAEAGYTDGFTTNCVIPANLEPELYQIVQAYFSEIGVEMEYMVLESVGVYDPYIIAGKHDQMCSGGGTGLCFAPGNIIRTSYSENTRGNHTYNNDSYYDDLVSQFESATTMEEAKAAFKEADMYSLTQHWILRICPIVTPIAWQPWVKGYSGELIFGNLWPFFYPARLWIDQELKKSFGY